MLIDGGAGDTEHLRPLLIDKASNGLGVGDNIIKTLRVEESLERGVNANGGVSPALGLFAALRLRPPRGLRINVASFIRRQGEHSRVPGSEEVTKLIGRGSSIHPNNVFRAAPTDGQLALQWQILGEVSPQESNRDFVFVFVRNGYGAVAFRL